MADRTAVIHELSQVIDPELGMSITELDLIEDVTVNGEKVAVKYHLTSNFCPPQFALAIASDIKARVGKLDNVKEVKQTLVGHFLADEVNTKINAT